jgi:hypothetical protein
LRVWPRCPSPRRHHHRGIGRDERAIGILEKSSWPGVSSRLKTAFHIEHHDGRGDGMPRSCSIRISRTWRAGLAARPGASGGMDRAAGGEDARSTSSCRRQDADDRKSAASGLAWRQAFRMAMGMAAGRSRRRRHAQ